MTPFQRIVSIIAVTLASATYSASVQAEDVPASAGKLAQCPPSVPFPEGVEVVKALRVFTAADGNSDFETETVTGESSAYFKVGELFTHNLLGAATKVQLVSGPPDVVLKPHATPYKEMFLTIQGSSTIILPSGKKFEVTPGTLVVFDDSNSKTGHGGHIGPCGYVAINIVPANPEAKP